MAFEWLGVFITGLAVYLYFLKRRNDGAVCESNANLSGKVVIITGANTGIGKESALDLALRGGKVYMACRSVERGTKAKQELLKTNPDLKDENLLVMQLDLSSIASIRSFAKEFRKKESKLHILMNNAGLFSHEYTTTIDGFETTFGVNHLGHFLLTNLLMEPLLAASPSRIINVSSRAHKRGTETINLEDVMWKNDFGSWKVYAQSKLANVIFTRELGKRLEGSGVTTYSLHPGTIATDIGRDAPVIGNPYVYPVVKYLVGMVLKDEKAGAQTQICCAVNEKLATETGKYYAECAETPAQVPAAYDDELAVKLWDLSVDQLKMDSKDIHTMLR